MAAAPTTGDRFIQLSSVRLHYLEWGNRRLPHILLVHGTSGTARFWDHTAQAFSDRFHLVAPTLRGRGQSEWTPGRYDLDDYVADLGEFAEHLHLDRLVFVGSSLGGLIGQRYAVDYSEQVERLVVVDIGGQVSDPEHSPSPDPSLEDPDEFDSLEEAEACLRERALFANVNTGAMGTIVEEGFARAPSGRWTWTIDKSIRDERVRLGSYRYFPRVWDYTGQIGCPTLVMRGAGSPVLSPEMFERMGGTIPGAELVEIPDAGHFPYLENPEGFIQALRRFVG